MDSSSLDIYLSIATEVYDLNRPTPPADAYKFYRSYVAKARGHIIEPMCGTGRFLLPLLQEGFYVCGFDASSHMLKALNNKAKIAGLNPMYGKNLSSILHSRNVMILSLFPVDLFL